MKVIAGAGRGLAPVVFFDFEEIDMMDGAFSLYL